MRSNSLQIPHIFLQLPPGCHDHHGHGSHGNHGGHGGHVGHGGHGGRGRHCGHSVHSGNVMVVMLVRTGQDRTGRDGTKLTFKLDFPGN